MDRSDTLSVQQALGQYLAHLPRQDKLRQAVVRCAWKKIMPADVQAKTLRLFLKEKTFFVVLSSAAVRHALQINKATLLQSLQAETGRDLPQQLVFL